VTSKSKSLLNFTKSRRNKWVYLGFSLVTPEGIHIGLNKLTNNEDLLTVRKSHVAHQVQWSLS
jgi:hypothetical protein